VEINKNITESNNSESSEPQDTTQQLIDWITTATLPHVIDRIPKSLVLNY
jgi:hypothetical protein